MKKKENVLLAIFIGSLFYIAIVSVFESVLAGLLGETIYEAILLLGGFVLATMFVVYQVLTVSGSPLGLKGNSEWVYITMFMMFFPLANGFAFLSLFHFIGICFSSDAILGCLPAMEDNLVSISLGLYVITIGIGIFIGWRKGKKQEPVQEDGEEADTGEDKIGDWIKG